MQDDSKRLIEAIEDDIYVEIDGFSVLKSYGSGCLYAHHLRWIADELDRRNEGLIDKLCNEAPFTVNCTECFATIGALCDDCIRKVVRSLK